MTQPPAGWYEDPDGTTRWWDGTQWTEHTQAPPTAAGPAAAPAAGPPAPLGGPTHLAYHPGQASQQPGQPGNQQGYPQQQPWAPYAGGPGKPPRRANTGLLLGIGGGVLALIVVAIVIVLVASGGDDNKSAGGPLTPTARPTSAIPSPTTSPTTPTPTAPLSEEPTSPAPTGGSKRGWPKELPTNAPDREPNKADVVNAPRNAPLATFCNADQLILDLPKDDLDAYYAWFWYRVQLGTPADMSAKARNGWIEEVAADAPFKKADENAYTNYEINKCY